MYRSIPNWSDWFFSPTRCKGAFSPETLHGYDRTSATKNKNRSYRIQLVVQAVSFQPPWSAYVSLQVRLLGWIFVISEPLRAFWATDLRSVSRWKVGLKRKQSTAPGNIVCSRLSPFLTAIIAFYSQVTGCIIQSGFIILWFQVTTKDASP